MMRKLQGSLNDSLVRATDKAQMYPNMSRDIVRDNVSFFREHCNPMASVELVKVDDNSFVRVSEWSNDPVENFAHVDMPLMDVFRLTNSSDVEHALNFLTIAFAMQAVSLLIVHSDFWGRHGGSSMRGVPLVSWQKMLQSIDVNANSSNTITHLTNEYYDDGDGPQMIVLNIDSTKTEVVSEDPVTAIDFPVVFPDMRVKEGYNCTVSLSENKDLASPRSAVEHIVRFTIDTSCIYQPVASRNVKRRKLAALL